jgi:hypothetical protein
VSFSRIVSVGTKQAPGSAAVPQYSLPVILLMFAWPAAWFAFLIYGFAPRFVTPEGLTPTWTYLTVSILGNGAELAAALLILRHEGYRLGPEGSGVDAGAGKPAE